MRLLTDLLALLIERLPRVQIVFVSDLHVIYFQFENSFGIMFLAVLFI